MSKMARRIAGGGAVPAVLALESQPAGVGSKPSAGDVEWRRWR